MSSPMPKDNEVDEKVMPVAWANSSDIERSVGGKAPLSWFAVLRGKREPFTEPLYSAATVAELRAEVGSERKLRLRAEGLCSQWITRHDFALESLNELTADRNSQRDRADAAERRVGELEAKARNWDDLIAARAETARDPDDAEWKMLARQGRKIEAVRACRALHGYSLTEAIDCVQALTGADPT